MDEFELLELREVIELKMNTLTAKERKFVHLRFYLGYKYKEIAEQEKYMTLERSRQIIARALRKMRGDKKFMALIAQR